MTYSIRPKSLDQMAAVPAELVSLAPHPYNGALNRHVALLKHKLTGNAPEPVFIPADKRCGQNYRGLLLLPIDRPKMAVTP